MAGSPCGPGMDLQDEVRLRGASGGPRASRANAATREIPGLPSAAASPDVAEWTDTGPDVRFRRGSASETFTLHQAIRVPEAQLPKTAVISASKANCVAL